MIVSIWRNLYVYLQTKNQLHLSRFPSDIAKILQTCYFGYFGHAWLCTPTVIQSTYRKLLRLSAGEKSTSFPSFFRRYCKDMQTFYFGYFGHAWLPKLKMIVSTCRKLRCVSACHKYTSSFISFLRYHILKNPAIWLASIILAHNSRARILSDMKLVVKYQ